MRILGRLLLLSLFVVIGVGLALYVGLNSTPSPRAEAADPLGDRNRDSADAEQLAADRTPTGAAESPAFEFVSPARALPAIRHEPIGGEIQSPAPVTVEPHPAIAFQAKSGSSVATILKALESLGGQDGIASDMLTPAVGRPTTQPPPVAAGQPDFPLSAPSASANINSPAESDRIPTKNNITRLNSEEGDDSLQIDIQNEDLRIVLESLSKLGNLNILSSTSVQGKVSATLTGVDVETALDAILKSTGYVAKRDGKFIFVGTLQDFDTFEQMLDTVSTRVYRPNYVTAAELQALIQPLVTADAGVVSVSSPAEVGIGSDSAKVGGDAFAGGEVVLVRDYEAVLAQIDQVVTEIDRRPLQVAIEAMILSVTLDDGNDFGVSFELLRNNDDARLGWGTPANSLVKPDFEFKEGGLKFGFLDSSLGAFISALETIGDTNVIATPRLMVINKHRAEILIGEELGYVSTTQTETSTTQSVEFLEVGTQLRLRPFISSDGLIRMEIHPELSTGTVKIEKEFTLPNKETTQVTTNIMVRDGCTMVIGGLMREEMKSVGSQVPLFGSLPLIGYAFRSRNEKLERREMLVLITPHIIYEPETCEEGEMGAAEFHRRQQLFGEKMNPFGRGHIARKYFRLAQNAWAAGDRDTALRFVEMSIHFNPLNRAAIDLRSDVWLGHQVGEHTLDGPLPHYSSTDSLDGAVIAPWILDDLEGGSPAQIEPVHPLDPGRPGRQVDIKRPRSFE